MVDDQQNSLLAAALEYASWGWRILPLHSPTNDGGCTCGNPHCPCPGKHPHIARWSKVATADPTIIRQWWERWPDANIGVATGKVSGLAVLDVDPRNGGDEVLEDLERREGDLPATVESLTGGGGRHVLFRYPEGGVRSRNGLAEGLDLKSDGGYFVAPASRHAAGRTYQWELSCYPGEVPLAEVPAWLVTLAGRPSGNGNGTPSANLLKIPEGKRNDTLARLAGAIRRPGMTEEAIRQALLAENQARCAPPLAVAEVARIARSVARYPPAPFSRHQSAVSEIHNSDLGNARRLVARHGLDIHHVSPRREWLVWDGTRWGKDDSGEVTRRAKETVNHLYAQASRAADPETRKGLAKFAVQSESEPRLRGMIELAKTEPGVPFLASWTQTHGF
jgi:putative DNA primase/helicase